MQDNNFKSRIIKKLVQLLWLGTITLVVSVIAGTTLYVFAAFTEPAAAPSASDQDFTENILGANNADNDFDSSAVIANNDGSIVERLENIQNVVIGYTNQKFQIYDDWNCANNNETADSA